MTRSPRLSIIIPTFNCTFEASEALESVLRGNRSTDLEVIVVDDGSTDSTVTMVENFQKTHENLHLAHQANAGAGSARNLGLSLAKGNYGVFLDADDQLDIEMVFSTLLPLAEDKNLDILHFDTKAYTADQALVAKLVEMSEYYSRSLEELYGLEDLGLIEAMVTTGSYLPSPCFYLWRRSLLIQNGCTFREGVIAEDNAFTFQVMSSPGKIAYEPLAVHRRRLRAESVTNSSSQAAHLAGLMAAFEDMSAIYKGQKIGLQSWQSKLLARMRRRVESTAVKQGQKGQ